MAGSSFDRGVSYTVEPYIFQNRFISDWNRPTLTNIEPDDPVYPEPFEERNKIRIKVPTRVIINRESDKPFDWRMVKMLVASYFRLDEDKYYIRSPSESFLFLKDMASGNILKFQISRFAYDSDLPITSQEVAKFMEDSKTYVAEEGGRGGQFLFDITYFGNLPEYTATYEVWIQMAGIESNHAILEIIYKLDGETQKPQ